MNEAARLQLLEAVKTARADAAAKAYAAKGDDADAALKTFTAAMEALEAAKRATARKGNV